MSINATLKFVIVGNECRLYKFLYNTETDAYSINYKVCDRNDMNRLTDYLISSHKVTSHQKIRDLAKQWFSITAR